MAFSIAKKQKHKVSHIQKHVRKHGIAKAAQEISYTKLGQVGMHAFRINDGYHHQRYRIERLGSKLFAARLEKYLAKRPHIDFNHPQNRASKLLYMLPAFPDWASLFPGAQALEPIHNPEHKRLTTGKRIDPITRRLFRHALDAIAIRTRTLMGGWIAHQYAQDQADRQIRWLSLAGGTAVPSMLMIEAAEIDKRHLYYSNIDQDTYSISIANQVIKLEQLAAENTCLLAGDIFDKAVIQRATAAKSLDVIDMMGIFEYLDTKQSVRLLKMAYGLLKKDGIIITCNMRAEHRQLNLHKRGVGWPDVRPRNSRELIGLCRGAAIPLQNIDIYQPEDGVYNVARIRKS